MTERWTWLRVFLPEWEFRTAYTRRSATLFHADTPRISPQTGTLSSLLTLSESLAKQDPTVTSALQKTVDTIRSLTAPPGSAGGSASATTSLPGLEDRASPLAQHLVLDDGRPYISYILPDGSDRGQTEERWEWNRAKYRTEGRSLPEIVDALMKEVTSIENAQKNKTQQYGVVKGQLATALRKKTCVPACPARLASSP